MATAFVNTAGPSNTHTHSLPLFSCLSVLCFWHPYYTPSHLNDDKTFALIPKDTLRTCTHCSVYVSVCAVYVRAWVGRPVGSCVELTHTDTHFWHMTMRALFSGWAEIIPLVQILLMGIEMIQWPLTPQRPVRRLFLKDGHQAHS